jgi:hypothetical protein
VGALEDWQLRHSTGQAEDTEPEVQLIVEYCEQAGGSVNPLQFGNGGHPLRTLNE